MRRIARSPSGPNPRRLAATGSSDGGATRPSIGGGNVFRQIRGVACHALFKNTPGLTRTEISHGSGSRKRQVVKAH